MRTETVQGPTAKSSLGRST